MYDLALEYAYDLSGRMTQESRTENGATLTSSFTYDALGQLTNFTRSDGQSESYAYDPVGNMTAKMQNGVSTTMRYNAANQLISSVTGGETTKYSYDANGNLTRSENAAGARSYAYNALGLLSQFIREDGYTETYSYNANRLLSSITTGEDLTTTLTWDILYGEGVVISAAQNGQTTSYTYGLERISAKTGSTRTEYIYDGRGSVAAEVSYNNAWYTFGGGLARKNVTAKSYTPFGEQIGEQASGFGYNGEYYNAATGMIYLRARFYEPEMNRFAQKDMIQGSVIDGISLNRYLYVQNDPVNFADYNGQRMVAVNVADGGGSGRNNSKYAKTTANSTTPTNRPPTFQEYLAQNNNPYSFNSGWPRTGSSSSGRPTTQLPTFEEYISSNNTGAFLPSRNSPTVQDIANGYDNSCGKGTCSYDNNTAHNTNWTIAVGGEAAAAFGVRLSLGGQLVFDSKGNVGVLWYNGFGGGTPAASLTVTVTATGAEDIFALEGMGLAAGGSLTLGIAGVGAEVVVGDGYGGLTFSGAPPLLSTPLPEAHGELTFTNVIDLTGLLRQIGRYDEVYSYGMELYEGSVS